ncbi:tRNA (uridine-2'-O-)-methyltransferase TRM7 [Aspergillus terreus NIH2624]|uniref:tRNA (Uridine-2'-O-)-methyltransferase TRM7 n=1 Tax=Aspergillus terreus (strain NIH 2624 / FGSC A1156) TaxID=341663 RepID=Q0CI34_ASPTN|nr:tRNA (uridine-2'-O-)-methyltransferase TRM7 [Aspergillus terreus NIH2624]EAU33194.1 tRNA (uridine-2'-O-)-methyltransferase TRM7 [Aspergillus terreus NIH2624]
MAEAHAETAELKPRKNVKIVSIDLQPMAPLEGITTLKADITHPSTIPLLLRALDPDAYDSSSASPSALRPPHPVDLVISDGAPDVTGLHDLDIYIQSQLLYAALNLALGVLRPGGKFVAKIFRGRDVDIIYAQLRTVFEKVSVAKPRSSRASSLESFVVCEGFIPPAIHDGVVGMEALKNPVFGGAAVPRPVSGNGNLGVEVMDEESGAVRQTVTKMTAVSAADAANGQESRMLHEDSHTSSVPEPLAYKPVSEKFAVENRWIPSFIACGDLSSWDSDASYTLPPGHQYPSIKLGGLDVLVLWCTPEIRPPACAFVMEVVNPDIIHYFKIELLCSNPNISSTIRPLLERRTTPLILDLFLELVVFNRSDPISSDRRGVILHRLLQQPVPPVLAVSIVASSHSTPLHQKRKVRTSALVNCIKVDNSEVFIRREYAEGFMETHVSTYDGGIGGRSRCSSVPRRRECSVGPMSRPPV